MERKVRVSDLNSQRFYKVKNPKRNFLCALCSAPRGLKYSRNISGKHYLQILIMSMFVIWLCFPLMGAKSLILFFPIWMTVEIVHKLLYRKDIPCPYCGFDATWYRRDVTVANQKVKDFWAANSITEKGVTEESIPAEGESAANITNMQNLQAEDDNPKEAAGQN